MGGLFHFAGLNLLQTFSVGDQDIPLQHADAFRLCTSHLRPLPFVAGAQKYVLLNMFYDYPVENQVGK